ncbi:hypothetical protein [Epilithonimonas tenax]|uniref:hypothetical protein n=1 Tax=Epilithonimonas tenax TaxID=191577 RepID=UPI0003FD5844|nr:hypothetical protein [Epilithonimonas tenax]
MNIKFFDSVLKYFTVIICCAIIGVFVQEAYSKNNPNISGNIVFLITSGSAFILYSIIVVILNEIIPKLNIGRFAKNINTFTEQKENEENLEDAETVESDIQPSSNDDQIFNEIIPILKDEKNKLKEDKSTREIVNQISDTSLEIENPKDLSDLDKIRIRAKAREEELIQEKLDLIVQYTKEKLALYITDEDLYKLCDYLVVFLRDGKIENVNPIKITVLGTTDLMHFGWNVWNHYRGNNQRIDVAKFLKTVFSQSFTEIDEIITIEKLLTSRKEQGIIKIEKNLLQ